MKRISRLGMAAALLVCTLSPRMARGQVGGYGGRGRGMGGLERYGPPAPKLPGAELDGPPDSATARELLGLTGEQAARYAQAYAESGMAAKGGNVIRSRQRIILVADRNPTASIVREVVG